MAQPYFNQAAGYFDRSTRPDISQFFNPYAGAVTDNLKDIFGQQMKQTTGNLTQQAGGVGADRIAVGQANLAKQQGLAAGQTLSQLYAPSLQAALSQSGLLQNAGYGTAALGQGAQNATLQGSQALLGTGGLQQQLSQAQMNAPYQLELARAAFPYQQSQFLSGTVGSLAPGLGGTTTGQSQTTKPAPSLFSQILGGITGGVGALGTSGAFGSNGWLTGSKGSGNEAYGGDPNGTWGGSSTYPLAGLSPSDYGAGFARGGRTDPFVIDLRRRVDGSYGFDDGGAVPDVIPDIPLAAPQPHIPKLNLAPPKEESGGGGGGKGSGLGDIAKLAMMFVNRGGRVNAYAAGGALEDDPSPANFDERFPYRMPEAEAVDAWRANAPAPDRAEDVPAMAFSGEPAAMPFAPRPRGAGATALPPAVSGAEEANPYSAPAPAAPEGPYARDTSSSFAASPWAALMAAGLGMMAGESPFAGVNIGQGGLQGLKTLEAQRAAAQKDTTIEQAARRLALEAKHHEDQYTRMTPYQKAQVDAAFKRHEDQYTRITPAQRLAAEAARLPYERLTAAQKINQEMKEREAAVEALKPVQIGQDAYGRPVYAKRNPKTGEYETIQVPGQDSAVPPAPATPAPAPGVSGSPPGTQPAPTREALAREEEGGLPKNAQFVAGGGPEPANPAALDGMREGDLRLVRAIGEGRQAFLALGRNNPYNRYIMEKVHEAYPDVDAGAFARRQRTQNSFSVGVEGRNITAINTFGQHLDEYMRLSRELNLGDWKDWNQVKNALAERGYTDKEAQIKIGELKAAIKAIGDEGAKVFAGSQSALADREEWSKIFDPSNPKDVALAKAKQMVKLVEGRLSALTDQYNQGMRTDRLPQDLIAKRTREVFERALKEGETAKPEKKADAAGPKVGERRQFKQGWGKWDGSKWVPD